MLNHDSPAAIRAVLDRHGIALKRRWGQNFLVNRGARERLVAMLEASPGSLVWEIGPGLGAMTEMLLARGIRVVAFEIDRGLCRWLEGEAFAGQTGFLLVEGDFCDTWRAALRRHGPPSRILGNLPYRSASLMIAGLVEGEVRPARCLFTVQRELADRMAASVGDASYSSFSVLCQCAFDVADRGDLQAGSFWPVPAVVSTIVELLPREGAPSGSELAGLSSVAQALFASRRKTVRNNARVWRGGGERLLAALVAEGVDLGSRAEELSPETYLGVVRRLRGSSGP